MAMQTNYPHCINFDMAGDHSHMQESTACKVRIFCNVKYKPSRLPCGHSKLRVGRVLRGDPLQAHAAQLAPGKHEAPHEKQSKQLTERE
jgi:hypothetical protein